MSEGWDRRTIARWVLGLGLALILMTCVFMFWLFPKVVFG